MTSIKLTRPLVIAISAAFALLLVAGFWWKLNPAFSRQPYFQDAARLQAEEQNLGPIKRDDPNSTPPPVASDKVYQPESGRD
jgi:hypothetical protein